MRRWLPAILLGFCVLTMAPEASAARRAASAPPSRWINVSVATLWVKPGLARPVDAPAGAVPADPRSWVVGMTTAQKRWLVGRLETQALYGTKVYLLATSGKWSKIAVPSQPTSRNSLGYPGWVPSAQLSGVRPAAGVMARSAIVRRPTAWAHATPELSERVIELSYGTRLPVATVSSTSVEVVMLDGRHLHVRRSAAALHRQGVAWPKLTGTALVTQAKRFLGLQYLWAGTSGFGFDCSGFTHAVYRALGTTIPRDAGDQRGVGKRVATRSALLPGDLVFFRDSSGSIHHVGMYIGDGKMIHAPGTGRAVCLVSLSSEPYRGEFAGGRRVAP